MASWKSESKAYRNYSCTPKEDRDSELLLYFINSEKQTTARTHILILAHLVKPQKTLMDSITATTITKAVNHSKYKVIENVATNEAKFNLVEYF